MLKVIIIDDEQNCVQTLQLMLKKKFATQVEVVACTNKPADGIKLLTENEIDILFLDVEMPGMSGIELLQQLQVINFNVIFTTAHLHYALKAIKLNALDYLTKPISLDELTVAINKCIDNKKKAENQLVSQFLQQLKTNTVKKIGIPTGTVTQFVPVNEIVRIESQSNYSIIYFINRPKQTVTRTLKDMEEQLAPYNFIRVHHSHLVNFDHVIGYKNQDSGYIIVYGNEIIEISRRKKQEVMERLQAI